MLGTIRLDGIDFEILDIDFAQDYTTIQTIDSKKFCLTTKAGLEDKVSIFYYRLFDKEFTLFADMVGDCTIKSMLQGHINLHDCIEALANDSQEWCNYCGISQFLNVDFIDNHLADNLDCNYTLAFESPC